LITKSQTPPDNDYESDCPYETDGKPLGACHYRAPAYDASRMAHGDSTGTTAAAAFPQTLWTVVLKSGQGGQEALEKLCRLYWPPIYAYARRWGLDRQQAQDVTQSFFMHILQKNRLAGVSPEKGRFRTWMLACARNFLHNEKDRQPVHTSGQPVIFTSLDADEEEGRCESWLKAPAAPDVIYDAAMAQAVVNQARTRLREEYRHAGKGGVVEALEPYLTGDASPKAYEEISKRLSRSEESLRVEMHRMRRRFGELLRAEVAEIVPSPDEVEDELRHLLAAWASLAK
jgi:RNA polymerase sigma factor (sigma-70 family)